MKRIYDTKCCKLFVKSVNELNCSKNYSKVDKTENYSFYTFEELEFGEEV